MLRLTIIVLAFIPALLRLMRLHLAQANDKGTPFADEPFLIEKPTNAQAIYGRLDKNREKDYYSLEAEQGTDLRAILLIPTPAYKNGLRATFTLYGEAFPAGEVAPKDSEGELTIAGRTYIVVRSYVPALPKTGQYQIMVEREAGEGTYCLCIGKENEGLHPDPEIRAKVNALLQMDVAN